MQISRFLDEPATEQTQPGPLDPPWQAVAPLGVDGSALFHPGAVNRKASTEPWANRSRRGRATLNAIALWLRRGLADAARAWALAAGVPPDLYN